jgi:glycerol-3-phosphate dehydrogenase (NAD(P)+)
MKIAVLGAGAWGTALAMHISQQHQVSLWARKAAHVDGMRKIRANPMYLGDFKFNDSLSVESDLSAAFKDADFIVSVVPTCGFRDMLQSIKSLGVKVPLIWANKGLEPLTAKLPHEVAFEELGSHLAWGAPSGPSFAAELVRGLPTAVSLALNDVDFAKHAGAATSWWFIACIYKQ